MDKPKELSNEEKNIYKEIGAKLKTKRLSLGYTQEQVGELVDVTDQQIGRIERGESNESLTTFIKICNLYKITTDEILYPLLERDIHGETNLFMDTFKKLNKRDKTVVQDLMNSLLKNT